MEEEFQGFTRFDDIAFLPVQSPGRDIADSMWADKFMRWHAERIVMDELNCTKTKAKNIVRGSLTRTGGVEAYFTCNGTYINRNMFIKFLARVKERLEQEVEEKEIWRQQREVSQEVNSNRTRVVRSAVVRNRISENRRRR